MEWRQNYPPGHSITDMSKATRVIRSPMYCYVSAIQNITFKDDKQNRDISHKADLVFLEV